ncbi:fatty acid 2-hydroylase [Carabus blaptoides fortunei]
MVESYHSKSAMYLLREYKLGGRNEEVADGQSDLEYLVDWNKAILPQVANLGVRYNEWVSAPVDRQLRLFESRFLEILTITPWYIVPIFWTPIIIYFMYSGIDHFTSSRPGSLVSDLYLLPVILSVLLGVVVWTLLEYSLHRWVFHMEPSGDSKLFIYIHFAIHGLHHKVPFDSRRLVFPPFPAAIIASFAYMLYSYIFPAFMLDLVTAGSMSGYVIYDMIHFYLHYGAPKENTYLYTMKRYHNQHHFSHSESGFGISSLYWDKIFGTAIHLRKLAVGIKW